MTALRVAQPIETLHGGGTALACSLDGTIAADARHGLFAGDTRVLSTYRLTLGGDDLQLLSRAREGHGTASWQFQNNTCHGAGGTIPPGSIFISLRRRVNGALHDDLHVTSYVQGELRTTLSLHLDADFADIFEVKQQHLPPRVAVRRSVSGSTTLLEYRRKDFRRALSVAFDTSDGELVCVGSHVLFDVVLRHGHTWACCIEATPEIGDVSIGFGGDPHSDEDGCTPSVDVRCGAVLAAPFHRGCADLESLAIGDSGAPFVAAGVPWFHALFGRDTLMTSLMTGLLGTETARGTLRALGAFQSAEVDDWRESEPGKLPHELRRGELAHFGAIPHTPYYATHDAQSLYCLALWNTWRWTGDRQLLDDHLETARAALEWCDRYGDSDGDGLQEYERRHRDGYYNQSWKDAEDAIVDAGGEIATLPLATVELQGYLYAARLAMAELLDEVGEDSEAARQRAEAHALAELVERRFYLADHDFYALALDATKAPLASISSNPGHLLWCGLPNRARAAAVATRIMKPDMFTGWGLRTLSADHPAYNPLSYQSGSVWPHDTAIAASGLARYGLHDAAATLLLSILDVSGAFEDDRLPELFAGFQRSNDPPVPYSNANVPQAWAAAAPILATQTFLGIVPDAPRRRCVLAPWLPEWLPQLAIDGIRIGEAILDVRISRDDHGTVDVETTTTGELTITSGPVSSPLWGEPVRAPPHGDG